jgi:hypothetical protein
VLFQFTYLKYYVLYKKYRYSIQWCSGNTGLVWRNSPWIEFQSVQRIVHNTVFIIYLEYAKDFHLFFFFVLRIFLLVKIRVKYLITGILLRARHSANIRAKRGYFTRLHVLKDASRLKQSVHLITQRCRGT